ncbi:MAG: YggS family pyridoxal phosphate-dependent enzyme [Chloroflexota bacterium]|nr:MAG: YggS family pyridoxal phosphate-dependent enzyme [Chloroflexota bacterium]
MSVSTDLQRSASDPAEVAALAAARARILGRIGAAARRVGREPGEVRLVAVSKTVEASRLRAAVAAGLELLGENRVQEALAKIETVPGAAWHLVGPLQANKARRAVTSFAMIETVDSAALAVRLDRLATELRPDRPLPVLLEVNVDADPAKAGFGTEQLGAALPALLDLPGLDVRGLMTVGRLVAEPEAARPTFVALRRLSEALRGREPRLGPDLSMGMSDDFEVAVEEGATLVRVGRAIFGERPDHRHGPGGHPDHAHGPGTGPVTEPADHR